MANKLLEPYERFAIIIIRVVRIIKSTATILSHASRTPYGAQREGKPPAKAASHPFVQRSTKHEAASWSLPIIPVADGEEAFSRANRSDFGLSGSVWPGDAARRRWRGGCSDAVRPGLGESASDVGPDAPLAGAKQSGVGVEWTELGLAVFCQVIVIDQAA